MTRSERLKKSDFTHLWHPFTQQQYWVQGEPVIVERGEGVELIDVEGRRYLDGISALWANVHGHSVPELVATIQEQAERLCHSTLLGSTHVQAIEFAELLLKHVSPRFTRVFYSDSGSAGVEAALRMALEWWKKSGKSREKHLFASLESAYHGDTLGAVSVGYSEPFHTPLRASISQAVKVSPPHSYRFYEGLSAEEALQKSITQLEQLFREHAPSLAAFIIEPLCQGAAGMWIHPKEYLQRVAELCRAHSVFLIVDEVATGFGKTGSLFAHQLGGIEPDLVVLGKGISAGLLPLSAVLATEEIYEGFLGEVADFRGFYFGQTFAGNPIATAVAKRSLELFSEHRVLETLPHRVAHFHRELDRLIRPLPQVDEIRSLGVMTGIELTRTPGKHDPYPTAELACWRVIHRARELGLIIRPLGNVLVLMPAVCMNEEDLSKVVRLTAQAIEEALGKNG